MTCPNCGSLYSACAECGTYSPIGTIAQCERCQAPHDCTGCGFTVCNNLNGVLKAADNDT